MLAFPIAIATRSIQTLAFFTYTDVKTILVPVSVFAFIVTPMSSLWNGAIAVLWIWVHLLCCNVSNQCNSVAEDCKNYPWRPIPAGLISQTNARILRWVLAILCPCFSSIFGLPNVLASILMVTTTIFYDDLKFSGHWAAKNICTLSGYLCFEVGAMTTMRPFFGLDTIALKALTSGSLIILSTIHIQDFPDVEGDTAQNRKTIPILAPIISRKLTSIMITFWSIYMAFIWRIGIRCSGVLLSVGLVVAWRLWFLRTISEDRRSYALYNGWLVILQLLPANARWGAFNF